MTETTPINHAGLLLPLDMFAVSQLAAVFGELLVSKARNILDAKMVLTRHPEAPLVLVRIEGHVVGDNPAEFWRENADLAAVASQVLPRQVFMFYVEPTPPERRREGFLVAQRGQVLAADDATQDRLPPNATDADWPVSRLCQQLRISMEELALGFVDGPRVEVSLVEPAVDDQAVLMVLLGRDGEALPGNGGAPPKPAAAAPGKAPAPAPTKPGMNMAEDSKRRAIEQAAEQEAQKKRAAEVRSGLQYALDDLGLVVAPKADLSEPDILAPFVVSVLEGDAPHGVPSHLLDGLQRRRIDVAVRVEFLSEVFIETVPLNRGLFEERAETIDIGGRPLKRLEVLAPRLGYGTLVSTGKAHLYISRKLGMPVPEKLVLELLDS